MVNEVEISFSQTKLCLLFINKLTIKQFLRKDFEKVNKGNLL